MSNLSLAQQWLYNIYDCQWSVIEIHSEDSWNDEETVIVESDSDNSDLVISKYCQSDKWFGNHKVLS